MVDPKWKKNDLNFDMGGAVASWLVRSTPDRVVWVWVLAGDIVLCSWARHYSHSAFLHMIRFSVSLLLYCTTVKLSGCRGVKGEIVLIGSNNNPLNPNIKWPPLVSIILSGVGQSKICKCSLLGGRDFVNPFTPEDALIDE